jgi:hypothetical protein
METRIRKSTEMSVPLLDEQRERDVNSSIHQTGPRATFCVDFWRFLLRSRTIPAKQRGHRLSSSFQDGFAGQERDHLPDQISHTPWAEPGNVAKPRTILYDMLSMARSVSQPGLVIELPYRWRRETYPPIVGWTADSGAAVSVPQTKSVFGNHVRY